MIGANSALRGLAAAGRIAGRQQSRNMGMGPRWLTKNKYVEEWNGRREITEKAFNASGANVANIVFYAVIVPLGVYWLGRSELQKKGDRRYKNMC
eukprot:CAMPEP_0178500870 /NCGR_PEP_ID=MMETSP0696-20121128/16635_1 /TAXON_ID=265572 /ORGANISM="Extubocellulus spinifer, Strain CCMP396" /LENGTH=94 /DNA_ID=CAMNT_0020129757 /DNA_START=29 /DNA_END=313 /DNA_ORIENTATION=-